MAIRRLVLYADYANLLDANIFVLRQIILSSSAGLFLPPRCLHVEYTVYIPRGGRIAITIAIAAAKVALREDTIHQEV